MGHRDSVPFGYLLCGRGRASGDLAAIEAQKKRYAEPIVTEVEPLQNFYPAEEYHQEYLEKNPRGYCHIHLGEAEEFIQEEGLKTAPKSLSRFLPGLMRDRMNRT